MSSTPPQYTLLPASPSIADEKEQQPAQLERAPSSSPSPNSSQARFRRALFLCTGVLATTVLVGGLYGANVAMGGCRWRRGGASDAVTMQRQQLVKRAGSSPTYSTSTYSDGETSTFVYTTRPIVNPGGYTIGTITGYVAEKPTATATSLVAPSSSSAPTPSEVDASSSAPSASPTYSTSTYGNGTATSIFVYTTRPIINPGGYTIGTITGYVPLTSAPTSPAASTTSILSSASPAVAPLAERDFAEVDMHLMHRRGVDFEKEVEEEVQTSAEHSAEYSLSIKKDGETVTFIKTTRPIINPGGYTIGILNGAYVKAPKSTTAPRDELKRRAVELEG